MSTVKEYDSFQLHVHTNIIICYSSVNNEALHVVFVHGEFITVIATSTEINYTATLAVYKPTVAYSVNFYSFYHSTPPSTFDVFYSPYLAPLWNSLGIILQFSFMTETLHFNSCLEKDLSL